MKCGAAGVSSSVARTRLELVLPVFASEVEHYPQKSARTALSSTLRGNGRRQLRETSPTDGRVAYRTREAKQGVLDEKQVKSDT